MRETALDALIDRVAVAQPGQLNVGTLNAKEALLLVAQLHDLLVALREETTRGRQKASMSSRQLVRRRQLAKCGSVLIVTEFDMNEKKNRIKNTPCTVLGF